MVGKGWNWEVGGTENAFHPPPSLWLTFTGGSTSHQGPGGSLSPRADSAGRWEPGSLPSFPHTVLLVVRALALLRLSLLLLFEPVDFQLKSIISVNIPNRITSSSLREPSGIQRMGPPSGGRGWAWAAPGGRQEVQDLLN